MICKHKDGWVVKEEFAISDEGECEVECECNTIGCKKRKTFIFNIENMREQIKREHNLK